MNFLNSLFGGLFGGGDAPTYQETQVSPESTMTQSQKAMQEILTALGKMGYEQGMKYLDPARGDRNRAYYNAMTAAIQSGGDRGPAAINQAMNAALSQSSTPTGQTQQPTNFTPNEDLEAAGKLLNYLRQDRSGGLILNGDPETIRMSHDVQNPITGAVARGEITQAMIDAYNRQKKAADDAKIVASFKGVTK